MPRQPVSLTTIVAQNNGKPDRYHTVASLQTWGSIASARATCLVLARNRFPNADRIRLDYYRRPRDNRPMESETFDQTGNRIPNVASAFSLLSPEIQEFMRGEN